MTLLPWILATANMALLLAASYTLFRVLQELRSRTEAYWRDPFTRWGAPSVVSLEVDARIRIHEQRTQIRLTPGARQMLLIPIVEHFDDTGEFDLPQVDHSLEQIFMSMREEPRRPNEFMGRTRNAVAVIRAFWKGFCNIPPFCSGKE